MVADKACEKLVFQLAEVAVPRALLAELLRRIGAQAKGAAARSMSRGSDERWHQQARWHP